MFVFLSSSMPTSVHYHRQEDDRVARSRGGNHQDRRARSAQEQGERSASKEDEEKWGARILVHRPSHDESELVEVLFVNHFLERDGIRDVWVSAEACIENNKQTRTCAVIMQF